MRYIKINQNSIKIIKEFRNISLDFWELQDVKFFYNKKQYKLYKKYRNYFIYKHILYKRKNLKI